MLNPPCKNIIYPKIKTTEFLKKTSSAPQHLNASKKQEFSRFVLVFPILFKTIICSLSPQGSLFKGIILQNLYCSFYLEIVHGYTVLFRNFPGNRKQVFKTT